MTKTETLLRAIASDVYKCLGSGQTEAIYHCAMEVGLRLRKIKYESEKVVAVTYRHHCVGFGRADLVVGSGRETVVVELKEIAAVGKAEAQQLRNYMKRLKVGHGLLVNFPSPGQKATEPEFRDVLPDEEVPDQSQDGPLSATS